MVNAKQIDYPPLSPEEIERAAHQIAAHSGVDADFLKGHIDEDRQTTDIQELLY